MSFRLPPLNALRSFEAAARHSSFKLASEELHVTPSAVSHSVRTLERWFGAKLFQKSVSGVVPTSAGRAYAEQIRKALSGLAIATEQIPGHGPRSNVSVSTTPTFARYWLLPRLSRFTSRFPEIAVTIDSTHRHVQIPGGGFDLAVRMAQSAPSAASCVQLIRESFVPVCAPALLNEIDGDGPMGLLARKPLIHVTSVAEDWRYWFDQVNLSPGDREKDLKFDTISMALEAAADGLGIAIGRRPLVDEHIATGRLVELECTSVKGRTCFWLIGAETGLERREVGRFRRWIMEEAGARPSAELGPPPRAC